MFSLLRTKPRGFSREALVRGAGKWVFWSSAWPCPALPLCADGVLVGLSGQPPAEPSHPLHSLVLGLGLAGTVEARGVGLEGLPAGLQGGEAAETIRDHEGIVPFSSAGT